MTQKETHDFMNVSSFSQLPFIRPQQAKEKLPIAAGTAAAIRIFGIDVPHDPAATAAITSTADTTRKFECHYCGRSFPTSQALGGHQNAHKRERQHAKRVQLQSAMAAAHHHSSPITGHHVHSLLSYHPLNPLSMSRFPLAAAGYHPHHESWRAPVPIHGSPLPAMWRAMPPAVVRPTAPFFRGEAFMRRIGEGESSSSTISSIEGGKKENVSLDLHL